MSDQTNTNPIEVLETQISAIADTSTNLRGLVEKIARIQAELSAADMEDHADALADSFSTLSGAVDGLQETVHDLEIERNRMANEG